MKMEIDKKLIETYALFKRHVLLLENHHENQDSTISAIEQAIEDGKEDKLKEILSLFNYVLLFVDLAVKIQKIALKIPKINQKGPEYRSFTRSLGELKELRNKFQHINDNVASTSSSHMLGTISWYSGSKIYSASLQDLSRTRNGYSMPIEVTEDKKLKVHHDFCYMLENDTFDLNAIYESCLKLCEYLDGKISLTDENGEIDMRKKYDIWAIRIKEVESGITVELA
jgi:hypothetical protein